MYNTRANPVCTANIPGKTLILFGSSDRELYNSFVEAFHHEYALIQITSGMQVLSYAQSLPVALVLLDVDVLDLDGLLAAKILKGPMIPCNIPLIIVHTTSPAPCEIMDFKMGCTDYFAKPIDVSTVTKKAIEFIRFHKYLGSLNTCPRQTGEAQTLSAGTSQAQPDTAIFNTMKDLFIVVDDNLAITYFNRAAAISIPAMFGNNPLQLELNFGAYLKKVGQYSTAESLELALKESRDFELEILVNHHRYSLSIYHTPSGAEIHYQNITLLKQVENDVIRMNNFNISTEMAASVAHEIKNPLTIIRALLELAKLANKPLPQDKVDVMITEIDRVNLILTDFLSLGKKVSASQEPEQTIDVCNLKSLIENIQPLLNAKAARLRKNIIYKLKPSPPIHINTQEVSQIVLNLVLNGLEAMESKGTDLTIATGVNSNSTCLKITDQGPGIDKQTLKHIWTPFFTSKTGGTGLGLAICQKLAHKNSAIINVDSHPSGTTFTVCFPQVPS